MSEEISIRTEIENDHDYRTRLLESAKLDRVKFELAISSTGAALDELGEALRCYSNHTLSLLSEDGKMTVGELKQMLSDIPDTMIVDTVAHNYVTVRKPQHKFGDPPPDDAFRTIWTPNKPENKRS